MKIALLNDLYMQGLMATLTSTKIKNTYDALLKSIDNDAIGSTAKQITDGLGNTTPLYVSTTQVGIGVTPESGLNLHVYGDAKIGSNLTVIGNLVVEGSTTTVGTDTLTVKDPLIVLANNNTSTDAVDIDLAIQCDNTETKQVSVKQSASGFVVIEIG